MVYQAGNRSRRTERRVMVSEATLVPEAEVDAVLIHNLSHSDGRFYRAGATVSIPKDLAMRLRKEGSAMMPSEAAAKAAAAEAAQAAVE